MSRLPDLIEALVARLGTDEDLEGVTVVDGPWLSGSISDEQILVGYDGDPEGEFHTAVTEEQWAGLGTSRQERIELPMTLLKRQGDGDVQAARRRIYEIDGVIRRLFAADPTLGLQGLQAAIGTATLYQPQTSDGLQTRLVLTVVADST